jgi:hypothetical protein
MTKKPSTPRADWLRAMREARAAEMEKRKPKKTKKATLKREKTAPGP